MPKEATGELRPLADGWAARITIQGRERRDFVLVTCANEIEAAERCKALAQMASRLRRAGETDDLVRRLDDAAKARAGRSWDAVCAAVDALCRGTTREKQSAPTATLRNVIDRWTKGELAKEFPDYVARKRSARRDVELSKHVPGEFLDLPLRVWTSETYHAVMRQLSAELSSGSRRHVAQLLHRAFGLAVQPLQLLSVSPISRMPKIKREKLMATLLPRHPQALGAAVGKIDLGYRFLWCFLAETGWRVSQGTGKVEKEGPDGADNDVPPLYWRDIKEEREVAFLRQTKTTAAVEVPLDPPTLAALAAWRKLSPCPGNDDQVFVTTDGAPIAYTHAAETFRDHLNLVGSTRSSEPDLFPEGEELESRLAVRAHDLRGLFVTANLAQGKSDTWVMERTLHKTRSMVDLYRRKVAHFRKHGPIVPAIEAIPELAAVPRLPHGLPHANSRSLTIGRPKTRRSPTKRLVAPSGVEPETPFRAADFKADSEIDYSREIEKTSPSSNPREPEEAPVDHAWGNPWGNQPSDAELERGILDAVKMGLGEVARTLSAQLEARQRARGGKVVDLATERRKR